jgi:hypothetical protein
MQFGRLRDGTKWKDIDGLEFSAQTMEPPGFCAFAGCFEQAGERCL